MGWRTMQLFLHMEAKRTEPKPERKASEAPQLFRDMVIER